MRPALALLCLPALVAAPSAWKASELAVTYRLEGNLKTEPNRFRGTFTLKNLGSQPIEGTGWSLHFNAPRAFFPERTSKGWTVEALGGDLYRLRPTSPLSLAPGRIMVIHVEGDQWIVNGYDQPSGPYVVFDAAPGKGHPIASFHAEPLKGDLRRTPEDRVRVPEPAERYAQNAALADHGTLPVLIPSPRSFRALPGTFSLISTLAVCAPPELATEAELARGLLGLRGQGDPGLRLALEASPEGPEAYRLRIHPTEGITLTGGGIAGLFYGLQSLRGLLPLDGSRNLSACEIVDAPRFPYRGLHLDSARNFIPKATVLRVLDLMGRLKLNVFHFHLTDDEGWRMDVPALPELREVASRRGHGPELLPPAYGSGPEPDVRPGSGHYSPADMVEILKAATARHIEVVLELEMPGHARAAIRAMEIRAARMKAKGDGARASRFLLRDPEDRSHYRSIQLFTDNVMDPALPSTYAFIDTVLDHIQALYKEAGAPLRTIHMGGDEVPEGAWKASPACQSLAKTLGLRSTDDLWGVFYRRLHEQLKARGLSLSGWEEIALKPNPDGKPRLIPDASTAGRNWNIYVWNNVVGWGSEDLAYKLANAGHKVVLTPVSNLYLDMAPEPDPREPGQYWGGFAPLDAPFRFLPLDFYRNAFADANGIPLGPEAFKDKVRLTPEGARNILGIQACLWTETVRDDATLEHLMLPRLFGAAERAWAPEPAWSTPADYQKSWNAFVRALATRELPRLDRDTTPWNYRIAPPGLRLDRDGVRVNHELPGLTLRYTTDGSEPDARSPKVTGPIQTKGSIRAAAFDTRGRMGPSAQLIVK